MAGKRFFFWVSGILLAGLFLAGSFSCTPAQLPLPVLGSAPSFELTNAAAENFNSAQLLGKIWVADFFFTTCPGPCPAMSKHMELIQENFANQPDVQLVNFSVNPDYDSPEVLAKYALKFNADPERWHFLTGPGESIHDISVKGFKIGDVENLIYHSQKFVLVDRQGQIRGYYDGVDNQEIQTLIGDIKRLIKE